MSLFDLFPAEVVGVAAGVCVGLFGGPSGMMGPVILGDSYDYTWSFFWGFARIGIGAADFPCALIPMWRDERGVKREQVAKSAAQRVLIKEEKAGMA